MNYWLLKSEPDEYSYTDLVQETKAVWNGVNNALALKNMRSMMPGDLALFYHTGKQRQVVGIAEIMSEAYPDPALNDPKRVVVDVRAVRRVKKFVTLAEIKADKDFEGFDLIRLSRLSVVAVSEAHWQRILALAGVEDLGK
ncbi:EVE domain-containing protein [Ancylothrix sp. C2]|uniref:EVE domain-containing protein n=1 Tax=Ancylothrix sp. D3o TaxID=2953691 RepID=UPI0021BB6774|nr:EVE domain-containing protein [Ancylothrix sp. D3o]MCT7949811.1 EVE domain-containing protein [Ancylothrix sp. D3o]